jgi:hypothetical protein
MSYWTYSVSYPVADHDVGELVCVEEGVEHAHVVGEPIALGGLVGFPVTQQVECEDFVITPQYRDLIVPDMPLSPALCSSTIGGPLPTRSKTSPRVSNFDTCAHDLAGRVAG